MEELTDIIQGIDTSGLISENHEGYSNWINPDCKGGLDSPCEFVSSAIDRLDNHKSMLDKYKNQIVIDLGAGERPLGLHIAKMGNARSYVAIEPDKDNFYWISRSLRYNKERPFHSAVRDDMLSFLRRLPDHSVSIWMSGVGDIMLGRNECVNKDYIDNVRKEIKRVLHPDGAYCEFNGITPIGLKMDKKTEGSFPICRYVLNQEGEK